LRAGDQPAVRSFAVDTFGEDRPRPARALALVVSHLAGTERFEQTVDLADPGRSANCRRITTGPVGSS
jgi:hypothetical protein